MKPTGIKDVDGQMIYDQYILSAVLGKQTGIVYFDDDVSSWLLECDTVGTYGRRVTIDRLFLDNLGASYRIIGSVETHPYFVQKIKKTQIINLMKAKNDIPDYDCPELDTKMCPCCGNPVVR